MIPHSKVFVGGLPSGSKPHELRRLFENYGVVTECDIMNRCGFVHMETPQMAETAIRGLHNTTFKGSVITVEPGRPKERTAGAGGAGGPGGGMRRGGSAPGPDRRMSDRGGMASGPPRGAYGPPQGGREEEGGIGPIRRDRGGGGGPRRGSEPYNRNPRGGGGGFQDNYQGGGGGRSRNFDSNSGPSNYNTSPRNSYGAGASMLGAPGYGGSGGSGGFGAVNQDKRGFALPAQEFRGGRGSLGQGGRGNPFSRPMPARTDGAGSGGFGNPNPFGRSGGRGPVDSSSGRPGGDRSTNRFRGGEQNSSGGPPGERSFPPNQNYNEAFPPLSATVGHRGGFRGRGGGGPRGGGFGRGGAPPNRNGPPRGGGMMNRYQ